jgi:hypothetical protein
MFPEFKCDHIASIDFVRFYASAFDGEQIGQAYFERLENFPLELRANIKLLLHQVARMIWLGDRIDEIAKGRPAFQVMFALIAAELAAKIRYGYNGEGQSRKFVHRFFEEICSDEHRAILGQAFRRVGGCLDVRGAVDYLYGARCDVVHMGAYYDVSLVKSGHTHVARINEKIDKKLTAQGYDPDMLNAASMLTTNFDVEELRMIVLEGAIRAADALIQARDGTPPTMS